MTDPLTEARDALRSEQRELMQRHLAGDDVSGAAALRIHNVLTRLDAVPAPMHVDAWGNRFYTNGWFYPHAEAKP